MLQAAVARSNITPPLGMTMLGYAGRDGVASGVDSDLTATLLALNDGTAGLAILSLDLALVGNELCAGIRQSLAETLRIPPSHVLVNCSHTHSGPTLKAYYYDDDPELARMRDRYEAFLVEEAGKLGTRAFATLVPARLGTASGEAPIGVNRREVDADGSIFLGENPDGIVDHEVRVIRVDDRGGRPIAVAFAHGCHTVTMGPKCLAYSPDFVGPARALVESTLGCPCLFLQANAGDINPRVGIGGMEDDSDNKNRTGWMLGGEVVKVASETYTNTIRGPRVIFGMLSKASAYPRVPIQQEAGHGIQAREAVITLPLYDFPSPEEARQVEADCAAELEKQRKSGQTGAPLNLAHRWHYWSRQLLAAVENGRKPRVQRPLQVLQIGDLAIASFPGETFAAAGLEVKRRSPFRHTLFLGYSNGATSYIPPRDAYPKEGWSFEGRYGIPDMHFKDYGLPSALRPGASETLVDKTVEMLTAMSRTKSRGEVA